MRVNKPRAIVALAGISAVTLALAGCAGGDSGNNGSGDNNTLTVSTSFVVKSIDPGVVYEATGAMAVHAMYDTLVTFEGSDVTEVKPSVAETFEISDDAKTFTFHLRDDVKFTSGEPLEADDVVFSLNRLKNLKSSPSQTVQGLNFEATDTHTVTVTSDIANPDVPTILAMPAAGIIEAAAATELGASDAEDAATADAVGNQLDAASIGSGPYVLSSFDPATSIVLKANPDYWGDAPEFDRVVIENVDVQNQRLTIEKAKGATLALDLSGPMVDGLADTLQVSSSLDTSYQLSVNRDPAVSEVTANPAFTQALSMSLDRDSIAELFGADAAGAAGLVPPAFAGALAQDEMPQRDVDGAKKLLADAGITSPSVELVYPAITYRGVDLGTIVTRVQQNAADAGIEIMLTPQPINVFLDSQAAGKNQIGFTPQSLNYPVAASLVNNMAPGASTSLRTGWTVERADQAAIQASEAVLATTSVEDRVAAMQEWQRQMNLHSPYIALANNAGMVVATGDLSNTEYSPAGWIVDLAKVASK